jgi:hypothetical protein
MARTLLSLTLAATACTGVAMMSHGQQAAAPPPQPAAAQGFTAGTGPDDPAAAADTTPGDAAANTDDPTPAKTPDPNADLPARLTTIFLPPSPPTRVRIAAIGVDAPVTTLALDPHGHLAAPDPRNRDLAGWYANGTAPGVVGNALMAGHVDTWGGPAVFYRLGSLRRGDLVDVDRRDGTTAEFTVDAVEAYASKNFPDQKVYGQTSRPEIRLITCGAGYDKARKQYLGNVVVYAHLTSAKKA